MAGRIEFGRSDGDRWLFAGVQDAAPDSPIVAVDDRGEQLAEAQLVLLGPTAGGGHAFAARLDLTEAATRIPDRLVFADGSSLSVVDVPQERWGRLAEGPTEGTFVGWAAAGPDGAAGFALAVGDRDSPIASVEEIAAGLYRITATIDRTGSAGDGGEPMVVRLLLDAEPLDSMAIATDPGEAEPADPDPATEDESAAVAGGADRPDAADASFVGHFDGVEEDGWAAGWARRVGHDDKVSLTVVIDGETLGEIVADQFREDLQKAGFADAGCAFWFGIPEELLDGKPHTIDLRYTQTGESIDNSPRDFAYTSLQSALSDDERNIIPNAGFREWPSGLSVAPTERLSEPMAGWYFDFRRGTKPAAIFSVEKPHGLALKPAGYALKIQIERGGNDGYMRLIVPLTVPRDDLQRYRFSVGMRRPPGAAGDELHLTEIFIGTITNGAVERIATVKRGLRQRGTQRVLGIRAVPNPNQLAPVAVDANFALVFDFRGEGEMLLFSPELSIGDPAEQTSIDLAGSFEDEAIRGQVGDLALSPIWTSHRLAVAGHAQDAAPRPATNPLTARGQSAVPFIAIAVPVFNAGADVEDMLRSIAACTDSPFEVHLFDDGSQDFTAARVSRWEAMDPRVRYQRHADNVGYTRNINIALQSVPSEFVVLLNSDTIVTPGWLRKLYEVMVTDDRIAGVGPLSNAASWQSVPRTRTPGGEWIVNAPPHLMEPQAIAALVEQFSDGSASEFPLLNGFCTLLRKSALEDVGYFDDASFPRGYGEENDLCLRLTKAGYTLRVATNAYVFHKKSKSFGVAQRKDLSKKANAILRGKHPEISFAEVEEQMRNDPGVNRVRKQLAASLGIEPQS